MRIAWLALQELIKSTVTVETAAALTEVANKQFFLAWGQTWCSKTQPQMAKLDLLTDVHSPDSVRVNAVLSNFEPFTQAFRCAAGLHVPNNRIGDAVKPAAAALHGV
jgi:predicted metalloendopeptidase